ncbi:MAG: hypothetical protein A4E52_01110 [Pelotomaculum sp. PtaB.Bin013]|nr:MAG: hypothetical protein A4E52_01110 [Pelotomaculum sp. PtaB.Bin013]
MVINNIVKNSLMLVNIRVTNKYQSSVEGDFKFIVKFVANGGSL